jgi:hypothetical protein
MIRITVEEEKQSLQPEGKVWKLVLNTVADDPKVIAGSLRALADKYDPQDGKTYR